MVGAALLASPAFAQPADEIRALREALEAQQEMNRQLLARVEALEAAQAMTQAKIATVADAVPDLDALKEEREEVLEDLRSDYFDITDRLDALPELSGYYDLEYINDDRSDSPGEFRQHHVSIHLSKEWESWRSFAEFEFEFGSKFGGDGIRLEQSRGEIKLEQAWAEYVSSDSLSFRGGLILTPGYWNVNHYPNVVLSAQRPLIVRNVFRESFVGLMAYGTKYWDERGLSYYAYIGNGQSAFFTKNDDNEGKAAGGKVVFHMPSTGRIDSLDLGLSAYHESPTGMDRVFTWGADAQLHAGPWSVLAEFAMRDSEQDRAGVYLQPSYRFNPRWAAFYRYDLLHVVGDEETQEHTVGVNYRPIPDVSMKLEYFYSRHSDDEDFSGVVA